MKRRVRQVLEGRRAKRVGGAGAGVAAAGVPTNGVSN